MGAIILKFIKHFVIKYFSSVVIEKIVIITLGELVKRTDSKVDDKLYEAVFGQLEENKEKVETKEVDKNVGEN